MALLRNTIYFLVFFLFYFRFLCVFASSMHSIKYQHLADWLEAISLVTHPSNYYYFLY